MRLCLVATWLWALGCSEALPVETSRDDVFRGRAVSVESQAPLPGLQISNARLEISVFDLPSHIERLQAETFTYLFLWVNGEGLFIVGLDDTRHARFAGRFSGRGLSFTCAGTVVSIENENAPLLSDGRDREAYVTYFRDYRIIPSGAIEPPDLVVGLARDFRQIPGMEHRNLPPEPCSS